MGNRVKLYAMAMLVDSDFKMFSVPKATGPFLGRLGS